MHPIERIAHDKDTAYRGATEIYECAKRLICDGKRARLSVTEHEDDRSLQANRYYWGPCLREIADQAVLCGQRYTPEAWHEFFKRQYLGYEIKKAAVAGRKRKVVTRTLRSTTGLGVKAFSKYLEQIQAFATTDLGVRFSAPDWREWQG